MSPKIAIVADWLTNYGGAESVISAFTELYPDAPVFTTVYRPERLRELGRLKDVRTSWLQKLPRFIKHQWMLGQMPVAVEMMDLSDFDVVLSSCHSVSKGVITKPDTLHICYCHTPMRYAWESWDLESRLRKFPRVLHPYIRRTVRKIRDWDYCAAQRVDRFIANSTYIAGKIKEHYGRESEVIYPPVHTERFLPGDRPRADYYFSAGRLIPYKKFDLLVETFNRLRLPLKIAGDGPEFSRLKKMAGPTVELLGYVSDAELPELYAHCKAFLFPQMEDAGIVPLEAMSCGRPVIAFDKGGSVDTMVNGVTGVLFGEQTVESLSDALARFTSMEFDSAIIRKHAELFDAKVFKRNIGDFVQQACEKFFGQSKKPAELHIKTSHISLGHN